MSERSRSFDARVKLPFCASQTRLPVQVHFTHSLFCLPPGGGALETPTYNKQPIHPPPLPPPRSPQEPAPHPPPRTPPPRPHTQSQGNEKARRPPFDSSVTT